MKTKQKDQKKRQHGLKDAFGVRSALMQINTLW